MVTLATLYVVLATGEITQFQFAPATCHILAETYSNGGHFQVWDAEKSHERWLHISKAVCVEPVEVTRLHLDGQD